jgi:phosphatidylinositol alpha-1,6-mannosyltransferase
MAVYVHGLDLIVPNRMYRWFWLPFVRRCDLCIANSEHTARLAATCGVPAARIVVVHPGVDLPSGDIPDAADFRVRFGLGQRAMLLSVGRLIARKGLLEFVEKALPEIAREQSDVCLVVLGDETPALLHGSSVGLGERIRLSAAQLGLETNLLFVGPQDDQTLAAAYAAADVHVFPVRDVPGDVEGFGMVAVEAAAYGLPTVAFAVGGVPDAVENGVSGDLQPAGDYSKLARSVLNYLGKRNDAATRTRARAFAERFSWEHFGSTMRQVISRIAVRESTK